MGLIRWMFRIVVVAVIAIMLIVGAAFFLVPGQRVAQVAADRLGAATGRKVEILGETSFTVYPVLGVSTGGLRIANAEWSRNGPMVQAESVQIGVDLMALIGGDIRLTRVEAVKPEILLEISAEGAPNWQLDGLSGGADAAPGTGAASGSGTPRAIGLDNLRVTGAALHLVDHRAGTSESFGPLDLTLQLPDLAGPATLTASLVRGGPPLALTARAAQVAQLLEGGISDISLELTSADGRLGFEGRAGLAPEAQGRLEVDLSDTAGFVAALGLAAPDLPQGLGRAATLEGDVTYTRDGLLTLRDGVLTLDGNRLTAAADITPGTVTQVRAQLTGGDLDFSAMMAGDSGPAAPAAAGWSTAPIDASPLSLVEGEIALAAGSVDLGITRLGPVRLRTTIERSRAVTRLSEVSAFGGTLSGEFVVNNRAGLSVGGDLSAQEVGLQPMLSDLAGVTRFTGAAQAQVDFLASGQSLAAMMQSLSGTGRLETGRGTIEGIDLDRLMRSGDATGGTTIFDATEATFTITDGLLRNEDLVMQLAGIRAEGRGDVDLAGQSIDYLFTPISLKARDGRGLAIPVRIRGPWSGPRITADLEQAIQLNFEEEKKELEQKARQEVDGKVRNALGIEAQEGDDLEDSLKRELEDQAKRGLLKLFNR
nr:AsmA family protein [Pseudooceanicola aestuarii]